MTIPLAAIANPEHKSYYYNLCVHIKVNLIQSIIKVIYQYTKLEHHLYEQFFVYNPVIQYIHGQPRAQHGQLNEFDRKEVDRTCIMWLHRIIPQILDSK